MAGFFHYLGRVFTEKSSWYKILTIVVLQALMVYFNPKNMLEGGALELNIPAILLYILASWLIFGFSVQIYSNALNHGKNVLPDLDFGGMFISTLRFIPFSLVWGFYFVLIGVISAMLMPIVGKMIVIIMVIPVIVLMLTLPVLMAIHAKNFSYKHVLNPITPFKIFRNVAGSVAMLDLIIALLSILLYGLIIGGAILIGFSGGMSAETTFDPVSGFSFILLLIIFFYVQNAIGFAYSLKLCDIIEARLSETEFLDEDFDAPTVDNDEDY